MPPMPCPALRLQEGQEQGGPHGGGARGSRSKDALDISTIEAGAAWRQAAAASKPSDIRDSHEPWAMGHQPAAPAALPDGGAAP